MNRHKHLSVPFQNRASGLANRRLQPLGHVSVYLNTYRTWLLWSTEEERNAADSAKTANENGSARHKIRHNAFATCSVPSAVQFVPSQFRGMGQ